MKTLDRYLLREWLRIVLLAEIGFPLVVIVIDLTDKLGSYRARGLTKEAVALSYLYYLPEVMFLVLPAAVLFATVFTVGPLARHSELTAAKASGLSFHRVIRPLLQAAAGAVVFGIIVGELAPGEIFGEMAIFERLPRSATVRARGPARVLTLDRRAFLRGVHSDPSLAYRLLQTMSHRVRRLDEELSHAKAQLAALSPSRPHA